MASGPPMAATWLRPSGRTPRAAPAHLRPGAHPVQRGRCAGEAAPATARQRHGAHASRAALTAPPAPRPRPPGGEEKRIPLASISAIALESEAHPPPQHPHTAPGASPRPIGPPPAALGSRQVHYEFSIDSTVRGKKFLFRAGTRAELEMWLNGLADLAP